MPPRPRTLEGASVTGTGRRVAAPGVGTAWAGGQMGVTGAASGLGWRGGVGVRVSLGTGGGSAFGGNR